MFDGRSAALAALVIAAAAAPARAQVDRPIPPAVLDARLVFAGLGEDQVTATALAVEPDALPSRGLGLIAGVHVYPIRRARFALGIGGELLRVRASAVPSADQPPSAPLVPELHRRLEGLAGQLSINFGHRDGWSYLTAGMGPLTFQTYAGQIAPDDPPRKSTINLGGGARWFLNRHLALNLDARFYLTRPEDPSGATPGRERRRLMLLSVGLSFK
jgi:hypothetical protein